MFDYGFPDNWSALKRLIWIRLLLNKSKQGTSTTVKGASPLSLVNAIAKKIRRLTQYGKCTVSGTDITCNNGVLKYDSELGIYTEGTPEEIRVVGKNLLNIDEIAMVESGYDRFFPITITAGTYCITCFGTFGNGYGSAIDLDSAIGVSGYTVKQIAPSYAFGRTQGATYSFTLTQEEADAVVSMHMRVNGAGITFADIDAGKLQIESGSTPTDYAPFHQETATASNLFAVGSIADEQDIISGTITRRCEAVVSDGTTPSGRYIGTVGEGNIIVQTKETGYSGAIASFTAEKAEPLSGLVAQINPVQDLHGYDAPWPAGGGVNKLPSPTATSKTANGITISVNNGVYSISGTATALAEIIFDLPNEITINAGQKTAYLNDGINSGVSVFYRYNNTNGAEMGFGGSTNRVSNVYANSAQANKMRFLITSGTVISGTLHTSPMLIDGSEVNPATFAPYSNECPITGWTGLEGQRTGANVFDSDTYFPSKGFTQQEDGSWYTNDLPSIANVTIWENTKGVTGSFGITYQSKNLNGSGSSGLRIFFVYADGYVSRQYPTPTTEYQKLEYTTDSNRTLSKICWDFGSSGNFTWIKDFCIKLGTDTTYEEYTGEPISVSWQDEAGTVYGGTDEVIGGNGTSTMGMVDLGTLEWAYSVENFIAYVTGIKKPTEWYQELNMLCSRYATQSCNSNAQEGKITINRLQEQIRIRDSAFNGDAVAFKTAMSGVQLCYELETPTTFTHDPQEVDTLVGQNNVWVDTGDVSAYIPDFTTEKVAGQSLSTTDGTNTVFVTSNVDPVELEVEYLGVLV